jgi:hypothetical protein
VPLQPTSGEQIYKLSAKRKSSLFRSWLIACAFMLTAVNKGNAQLFTPSINDLVNRKGFAWRSEDTAHNNKSEAPNTGSTAPEETP